MVGLPVYEVKFTPRVLDNLWVSLALDGASILHWLHELVQISRSHPNSTKWNRCRMTSGYTVCSNFWPPESEIIETFLLIYTVSFGEQGAHIPCVVSSVSLIFLLSHWHVHFPLPLLSQSLLFANSSCPEPAPKFIRKKVHDERQVYNKNLKVSISSRMSTKSTVVIYLRVSKYSAETSSGWFKYFYTSELVIWCVRYLVFKLYCTIKNFVEKSERTDIGIGCVMQTAK